MRFREYDNVVPLVLAANTAGELERKIQKVGDEHNVIDLQFSSTDTQSGVEYSALLLIECISVKTQEGEHKDV